MTIAQEPEAQLIELDARRRTNLRVGHHSRYLATEYPDGTIVMEPAVIMSEAEARLLQRPDILDAVEQSRADVAAGAPSAGRPSRRRKS